jgi:hypothetical protein
MVLLYLVVQVFRRAQRRIRRERAIDLQLTHRTVRCSVAVQRDYPRGALLAFDGFTKKRLGGRDIALGTQPEVNRPACPINATIQVAPLASDLDVCLVPLPAAATAFGARHCERRRPASTGSLFCHSAWAEQQCRMPVCLMMATRISP